MSVLNLVVVCSSLQMEKAFPLSQRMHWCGLCAFRLSGYTLGCTLLLTERRSLKKSRTFPRLVYKLQVACTSLYECATGPLLTFRRTVKRASLYVAHMY